MKILSAEFLRNVIIGIAGAMTCSVAFAGGQDVDEHALTQWKENMANVETPGEGCFQATYPNTVWDAASCQEVTLDHPHPLPRFAQPGFPRAGETMNTGNGNDYALVAKGLISSTVGSFPSVSGMTSEYSVGTAAFGWGGILNSNEYSLQVNTNANEKTSACNGGASGCTVWQQFVYATDYVKAGTAGVFMQYWLIGYGASGAKCPGGYGASGTSCYKNSLVESAPNVPPANFESVKVTASVVPGGNDTVTFLNGSTFYRVTAPDSVLQMASAWNESEFNVVGDAGGSDAVFNPGTSLTVNVAAQYGSTATPGCASGSGTTGETNSLTLGGCSAVGGSSPYIQFTESSTTNTLTPGGSLAPAQYLLSASGRFKFIQQSDGNLVLYDLGENGIAIWASGTNGKPVMVCDMQSDGNLVQYASGGKAEWAAGSYGNPGAYLIVQNDGNVVIYKTNGTAVWATGTNGR